MGHYASEMQCDDCGKLRCICIREPAPERLDAFVVEGFEVITVREYKERHRANVMLNMELAFLKKYDNRLHAEKAARKACEEAVEATRFRLTTLKHTLKVERPWEEKK